MGISGARFLGSSFALVSAWLLCNATLALADPFPDTTKPHFCKNTPAAHVDYPPPTAPGGYEQITGATYTWMICAQQSGASEWYFVVKNGATKICQVPVDNTGTPQIETVQATDGFSFTCTTTLTGLYTASVYWKVAGSSTFMNHTDYFYRP